MLRLGGKHSVGALARSSAPPPSKKAKATSLKEGKLPLAREPTPVRDPVPVALVPQVVPALPAPAPRDNMISWMELPLLEPQTVEDAVLFPLRTKSEMSEWVAKRLGRSDKTRPLAILAGPSGCGKRTLVRTLAKAFRLECCEPEVHRVQDLVQALEENAMTTKFTMGHPGLSRRRVWLFTGVDGLFKASAETSSDAGPSSLRRVFASLAVLGPACPLVIFTVHDFDGQSMNVLRKATIAQLFTAQRPDPARASQVALVRTAARRVCLAASVDAAIADRVMSTFDGDLKQMMLRLEMAVRGHTPLLFSLTQKDTEVSDAFEAARLLFRLSARLDTGDILEDLFDKFGLVEPLAYGSQFLGMEGRTGSVDAMAACADAWSFLGLCNRHWCEPKLRDLGRIHCLLTLRHQRRQLGLSSVEGARLQIAQRPTAAAYRSALNDFREDSACLEPTTACVERMQVLRLTRGTPKEFAPLGCFSFS